MVRRCVWGELGTRRKVLLLSWDTLCKPKEMGGVGLRTTKMMNKALLAKLAWRVVKREGTTWCNIL